ncbi:hypothetical protein IWW50_005703, partial [Coemansia erecta]
AHAGMGAPALHPDAQSLAHHIDIATAAAIAAATQLSTPGHPQPTQHQLEVDLAGLSAQQVTASMMQAAAGPMIAPALAVLPGAAANGLGITTAQLPTTPATTPGTQTIQAHHHHQQQQQQQMLSSADILAHHQIALAAMNSQANAGIQFSTPMQVEQPQSLPTAAPVVAPAAHTHSRSISVVDGMVAMYPNDSSSSVTPRSGIVMTSIASTPAQPITAQLQQQLRQHQMEQEKEQALSVLTTGHDSTLSSAFAALSQQQQQQQPSSGQSANASTATSANPSGVPSPYATPLITTTAGAVAGGHRRQLSSTFPAAAHQQQQAMMYVDTPNTAGTAPQTLVPGTPTAFGQLHYQMAPGAHHGHGHGHGHSRHLSLDTANFRLMSADIGSFNGLPLQQTIQEHSAEMVNALQLDSARSLAAQQQQFQLQQQLHQFQQMQTQAHAQVQPQHKAHSLAIRTVPVTPQNPMSNGLFPAVPQPAALSDSLAQHQQQLQAQHGQHQRHAIFHHSSSS